MVRGVDNFEIGIVFESAHEHEGQWKTKCHLEFQCDIYFATTGSGEHTAVLRFGLKWIILGSTVVLPRDQESIV